MGAYTFCDVVVGDDMASAFDRAVEQAKWEHGRGGYSGTIAEKDSFTKVDLPDLPDTIPPRRFVELAFDGGPTEFQMRGSYVDGVLVRPDPIPVPETVQAAAKKVYGLIDDKWGPAGACDVTDTDTGRKALDRWLEQEKGTGMFENGKRVGPEPSINGKRVFMFFGWASS